MIILNEECLRRPRQAVINRYMYVGNPLMEQKYDMVDGRPVYYTRRRFETWVTKEFYDSVPLVENDAFCENIEFMLRREKGWDTASLYIGARAIVKEAVRYVDDPHEYYCMVIEYSTILSTRVDYDNFISRLDGGESPLSVSRSYD